MNETTIQTLRLPEVYSMIAKFFQVSLERAHSEDIRDAISNRLHSLTGQRPLLSAPNQYSHASDEVENLVADIFSDISETD